MNIGILFDPTVGSKIDEIILELTKHHYMNVMIVPIHNIPAGLDLLIIPPVEGYNVNHSSFRHYLYPNSSIKSTSPHILDFFFSFGTVKSNCLFLGHTSVLAHVMLLDGKLNKDFDIIEQKGVYYDNDTFVTSHMGYSILGCPTFRVELLQLLPAKRDDNDGGIKVGIYQSLY